MYNFNFGLNAEELLGKLIDPVVLVDHHADVLYFNPAFSRLSGYGTDTFGQNLNFFIEESFIPEKDRLLQEVLKTGSLQGIEANLKTAAGRLIPLLVSVSLMEHNGKTLIFMQIKDITEKQKVLARLTAGEARFKAVFDNAFDPVFITEITPDKKVWIRYVNRAACEQYGYSEEEFTSLTIDEIDDETGRKEIPKRIKKLLAGEAISFVTTHVRKDGSRFPCKVDTKIVEIDGKKCIYASHHDLTEQLAYENALAEREAKYHFLADNTYDWEYWLSPEGKYEYISPACKRITGYSQQDFVNNPSLTLEIVDPDYKQVMTDHFQKEIDSPHGSFSAEFKIIRSDGKSPWIKHYCFPIYDKNGKYVGRRGVNRDITERKEAELEVAASKRKIENYMNMAPVLFFVLDNTGRVLTANQKVQKVLGFSQEELLGKNIFNKLLPQNQRETAKKIYSGFMQGKTDGLEHFEQQVLNANGEWRWMAFTNALIWDEIKREMKAVVAAEDVTGKKRNLDMLRKLNQAVKDATEVIFITDKEGVFTFVNPEFTRFTAIPKRKSCTKQHPES